MSCLLKVASLSAPCSTAYRKRGGSSGSSSRSLQPRRSGHCNRAGSGSRGVRSVRFQRYKCTESGKRLARFVGRAGSANTLCWFRWAVSPGVGPMTILRARVPSPPIWRLVRGVDDARVKGTFRAHGCTQSEPRGTQRGAAASERAPSAKATEGGERNRCEHRSPQPKRDSFL